MTSRGLDFAVVRRDFLNQSRGAHAHLQASLAPLVPPRQPAREISS